jgi:hypothetical protein
VRYVPALFFIGLAIVSGEGVLVNALFGGSRAVGDALGSITILNVGLAAFSTRLFPEEVTHDQS